MFVRKTARGEPLTAMVVVHARHVFCRPLDLRGNTADVTESHDVMERRRQRDKGRTAALDRESNIEAVRRSCVAHRGLAHAESIESGHTGAACRGQKGPAYLFLLSSTHS